MTAADAEDLDPVFRYIEATKGTDMAAMRQMATALAEMEVGDHTPPPRSRLPDPTGLILPPLHNGINEPPEGKFYLPPFNTPTFVGQRQYKRLSKKVRLIATCLTGLTMCFISLLVVLVKAW